jgi:hypothetical protein
MFAWLIRCFPKQAPIYSGYQPGNGRPSGGAGTFAGAPLGRLTTVPGSNLSIPPPPGVKALRPCVQPDINEFLARERAPRREERYMV